MSQPVVHRICARLHGVLALATLIGLWVATPAVYAQLSTASINGTVQDASGSSIPDAVVTLRNVGTNIQRETSTNASGNYVLLNVPPGTYVLEAAKSGFGITRVASFTLVVNQTATFNLTLTVESVQQSVTVDARGSEVQASTAELGAVVGVQQVSDLPLNGRNFTQLLVLSPGVAPVNNSQNSGGWLTGAVGQFTFPSINGQTNRSNLFLLDGIQNYSSILSTYALAPIIDTVQEFKVESHNDQAEFGQVTGGVVDVVTKSGTNQLHGTAWEFLRNDALDARNFFLSRVTPYRWNQFGASGGGPVVLPHLYDGRNRTFFFVGYQGFRFRQPANTYYRVPTAANLAGDLSDQAGQIYNPFSTRPDPARLGSFLRDPFPGNQIPANLIDPGMLRYAKATLPAPMTTSLPPFNALDTTPTAQNQEEYSARVDQVLRNRDFLWFRYSGALQDNSGSGGRQSLASLTEYRAKNVGISWVHTFGPTSVLQVQLGRAVTRYDSLARFRSSSVPDSTAFAGSVGFAQSFVGNFSNGKTYIPSASVTDFFSGGENDGLQTPTATWQERANYSKVWGKHTLKLGGEVSSMYFGQTQRNPTVTFAVPQTSNLQSPAGTGSSLASFLLGLPDSLMFRNTVTSLDWGGVISGYVQDQWKVTPNFTVNLGLRYDRTVIPPLNQEIGDLDLLRGLYIVEPRVAKTPSCAQRGVAPCIPTPDGQLPPGVIVDQGGKIFHDTTKNFQPRFGMAYHVLPKTVIRGSFGVFFDNWAGVTQMARNTEGTWPSSGATWQYNLNNPTSAQPLPTVKATNPLVNFGPLPSPTPWTVGQYYFDPYIRNPYALEWNFGVQHEIAPATVLTVNYVGSGGRRLAMGGFYNTALTPGPGDPQARAPFPWIIATNFDRSWGRSSYNSLQVLLDKKVSGTRAGALAYMISYTWSKSIDIGCSGWFGVEGCSIQNPYTFNNDRSVSSFDLTHVLTVNWIYDVPVGRGKPFQTGSHIADYILGNWQVNGIAVLRSGQPYTINVSGDIANTGNAGSYMRSNLVGNPSLPNPDPSRWFDRSAFAVPAPYTFGNLGRNRLRSDWQRNLDVSLFRQFPFTESKILEFRAEAFNTFNTPTFSTPVSNMSSPNFGRVLSTANAPRVVQFGLKLIF